jgi:hypothetical protein
MFMESFKTSSGETIHTAIGPLQTMQKEIIDVLTKTKDRVTAIEEDNDSTKVNVAELQKQMTSLQQNLLTRPTPPSTRADYANVVRQPAPPPPPPTSGPCSEAVEVLRDARMVVGFSPIRFDDVNYLKRQHSIEDDATAMMRIAIIEFLTLEMKVPKSFTDTLVLKSLPSCQTASKWLVHTHAEFPDKTSADLIHQYVRNFLARLSPSMFLIAFIRAFTTLRTI